VSVQLAWVVTLLPSGAHSSVSKSLIVLSVDVVLDTDSLMTGIRVSLLTASVCPVCSCHPNSPCYGSRLSVCPSVTFRLLTQ